MARFAWLSVFVALAVVSAIHGAAVTPSDISRIQSSVLSRRNAKDLWSSAAETQQSLEILAKLGLSLPSNTHALCDSLSGSLTSGDARTLFHSNAAADSLSCEVTPESHAAAAEVLKGILSNEPSIQDVYHALRALTVLKSKSSVKSFLSSQRTVVLGAVSKVLKSFDSDSGLFKTKLETDPVRRAEDTAFAYDILASAGALYAELPDDISLRRIEVTEKIADVATNAAESVLGGSSFGSLRATSLFVRGVYRLAVQVPIDDFPKSTMDKLSRFLLANLYVDDVEDILNVVAALHSLSNNRVFVPVVLSEPALSGNTISVRVTNVMGKFATPCKVSIEKISNGFENDRTAVPFSSGSISLSPSAKDNTEYSWVYTESAKGPVSGLFSLTFKVRPTPTSTEEKDRYAASTASGLLRLVRFAYEAEIDELDVRVKQVGDSKELVTVSSTSVKYPSSIDSAISLKEKQRLTLSFSVHDKRTKKAVQPQQVFVKIFVGAIPKDVVLIAKYSEDGKFSTTIDMKTLGPLVDFTNGEFSLTIVVADPSLFAPITWKAGTVSLTFPASSATPKKAASVYTGPRPVISHVFRQPEKRPSKMVSTAFTVLSILPFVGFLITIKSLGVNLSLFPTGGIDFLYAAGFQAVILAILLVLVMYWFVLTIFEAAAYLLVIGVVGLFIGNKALSSLAASRKQ